MSAAELLPPKTLNVKSLLNATFTDSSIGRELVTSRTGTQSSPGLVDTHMAAATVVLGACSSCRRWKTTQPHTVSHHLETNSLRSSWNLPQVIGSSLPSEQCICPSHLSSADRHVPSGQRMPSSPHRAVRDNQSWTASHIYISTKLGTLEAVGRLAMLNWVSNANTVTARTEQWQLHRPRS